MIVTIGAIYVIMNVINAIMCMRRAKEYNKAMRREEIALIRREQRAFLKPVTDHIAINMPSVITDGRK